MRQERPAPAPGKPARVQARTARRVAAPMWSTTRPELHTLSHRRPSPTRTSTAVADPSRWRQCEQDPPAQEFRDMPPVGAPRDLSLIHISEPTRLLSISYAVFCLKKKKKK